MGALLSLPITLLNLLLPFTKPGTPIIQDLIHTVVLCGTLYYAPQIAEWHKARQLNTITENVPHDEAEPAPTAEADIAQDAQAPHAPPQPHAAFQPQVDDEPELVAPQPGPADAAHEPAAHEPVEDAAGPAERLRPTPQNRAVGAKKAKSLARKDQRRAYHEFHRQEAELRRLQAAEGAEERDAMAAAERARRAAAEAEIVERERKEREERKREAEREVEEENKRRERVVSEIRDEVEREGAVDLVDVAWREGKDRVWIERLVRASGVLTQVERGGAKAVITSVGWLVKVDAEVMRKACVEAEQYGDANGGKLGFEEFGMMLERAVKTRG